MADVVVFQSSHSRAGVVCDAMLRGIKKCRLDKVRLWNECEYGGEPISDIAVFYGASGKLRDVMRDYIAAGRKAIYIDLGYWGRHAGGRRQGFHKIIVNGRHPTAYYQNIKHTPDRWKRFNFPISQWVTRPGGAVLVAGTSAKGANFEGFEYMEWEKKTIDRLKKITSRRIIYRPKPTCPLACPIAGVSYSPPGESLHNALSKAAVVVSHHSNTNIEAILAGICSWTQEGVAIDQSQNDLDKVEELIQRRDRLQWVSDIAYTQWNVQEMTEGKPWSWLKNEGLI